MDAVAFHLRLVRYSFHHDDRASGRSLDASTLTRQEEIQAVTEGSKARGAKPKQKWLSADHTLVVQ
eukprot:scaffold2114_cov253-Pinguiococcus_pyrenoidosus.AAC.29